MVIPLFLAVTQNTVKILSCCHKLLCKVLQVNQVRVKNLQPAGAESALYFESYRPVMNLNGLTRCYYLFKKLKLVFAPIKVQKQWFSFIS